MYVGLHQGQGWAGGFLCGISTEVKGIAWMQGQELVLPQVTSNQLNLCEKVPDPTEDCHARSGGGSFYLFP